MALAAVCVIIALTVLWHARTQQTPTQLKLAGASSIVLAVAVTPFMATSAPEPLELLFHALVVLGAVSGLAGFVLAHRQETVDYRTARRAGRPALAPRWPTGLVWLTWFLICLAISYGVIAGLGAFTEAAIAPLVESPTPQPSAMEDMQREISALAGVYLATLIFCTLMPFIVPTLVAWRYDRRTKALTRAFINELEDDDSPTGAVR